MSKKTQSIDAQLKKELGGMDKFICLMVVNSSNQHEANYSFIKHMLARGANGVYVTTNNPYPIMAEKLSKEGIPVDRMFFIDGVSNEVRGKEPKNCLYLDHLENLTGLGIMLNHTLSTAKGKNFLVIDSMSTLLLYNAAGCLAKFAHFLTARMKMWGVSGVYLSLKDQSDPLLMSHLSQICDKIIDLSS